MDKRAEFVRQWFGRAQESIDDFEKYIFLYLCLVVVIKGWEGNNGKLIGAGEENDDGWYVNKYFGSRYEAAAIVELCEKLPSFKSLVKRKTDEQFFIVDTNKSDDRALLRNLYNNYLYPNQSMTTSDKSRAIGICLKAIRNNLFHGGKLYESGSDQELLKYAVPVLEALVVDGAKRHMYLELIET